MKASDGRKICSDGSVPAPSEQILHRLETFTLPSEKNFLRCKRAASVETNPSCVGNIHACNGAIPLPSEKDFPVAEGFRLPARAFRKQARDRFLQLLEAQVAPATIAKFCFPNPSDSARNAAIARRTGHTTFPRNRSRRRGRAGPRARRAHRTFGTYRGVRRVGDHLPEIERCGRASAAHPTG